MFTWIIFILSGVALGLIFLRRYQLTRKGLTFEEEMRREEARRTDESQIVHLKEAEQDLLSDLELKRQAEHRAREERNRRLRESKKTFKIAELHFSKGDYGLAEKHLLQVLSFDNDHLDANLKLGLLYLHQENLPRAEFFFSKLLDLKESPVYYSNLALTLFQQGRHVESAKHYEKAIELDNKKPGRFVSLAYVYEQIGEKEKALANFEEAVRLDPRNLNYWWTLLEYYEKFSRTKEMRRVLNRILDLDPYNEEAKGRLALLEDRPGDEAPEHAEEGAGAPVKD